VIDCFSRYAWAIPLKNKTAKSVTEAFETLFKDGRICKKLWVDQGSEFYNKTLKKLLDKHNIILYSSLGDHKSAVVERFNRTLREKMWLKFTANNDRKWINILPSLLKSYNETKHRSIKMTPIEASKPENEELVYFNMNNTKAIKIVKPKLKVGDFVRISRIKGTFEKGYIPNWSRELFKVREVLETLPVTYHIDEYDGTNIIGAFYEQELQKTEDTETYLIEEILETKKVKGQTSHLVKWLGWNTKYNSWISDKDLKDLAN
jgi:transposase InsO family protein